VSVWEAVEAAGLEGGDLILRHSERHLDRLRADPAADPAEVARIADRLVPEIARAASELRVMAEREVSRLAARQEDLIRRYLG
jgi:hypothetical protein